MKKDRCVYTVITRGYDDLRQPKVIDDKYDYICFCNEMPQGYDGVWEIRHFDTENQDIVRSSRRPKMKPFELLGDYTYSLYIDANVEILDRMIYDSVETLISKGIDIGHVDHIWRQDMYMEINFCMIRGFDEFMPLARTYWHMVKAGFPPASGLFENNIIFRRHNDPVIVEAGSRWWDMYKRYTKRDQCHLMYIYWQLGIKPSLLLPEHTNTRNSEHVTVLDHNKGKDVKNDHTIWEYRRFRIMTAIFHMLVKFTKPYKRLVERYRNDSVWLHSGFDKSAGL